MRDVISDIQNSLRHAADAKTKESGTRYFKEAVKLYGVKTATVSIIGKKHFETVKEQTKAEIFDLCERLWQTGYMENAFIACQWAHNMRSSYSPDDITTFERWLQRYVSNWAACDTLCNHTIGEFLERFPEYLRRLRRWAISNNRWLRRAAAVSLIVPARHGKFLPDIFAIADILLTDKDDLVQKGYGWMLKAASVPHRKEVHHYVMDHKARMPRTALRYAIEKMPAAMKKKAML
ncbi:MAG: DNA alkylation repair protein [Spirochaetes bacterium]|nr:DNA alkylation repair protein [Spirochaetota bacterium]